MTKKNSAGSSFPGGTDPNFEEDIRESGLPASR